MKITTGPRSALAAAGADPLYDIPDVASPSVAGMALHADSGQDENRAPICGAMSGDHDNPAGLVPVAGRGWVYRSGPESFASPSADVTVTGWVDGIRALNVLTEGGTHGVLLGGWREVRASRFTRTYANDREEFAVVTRVGEVLAAVRVDSCVSASRSRTIAMREIGKVAGRLAANYPPEA